MIRKLAVSIAAALLATTAAVSAVDPAAAAQVWPRGGAGHPSHFAAPHFGTGHFAAPHFGVSHFAAPRYGVGHFGRPSGGFNRYALHRPFAGAHVWRYTSPRYGVGHFAAIPHGPRYGAVGAFTPNTMMHNRQAMAFRHGRFDRGNFRRGFIGWAGPVFWPYAYDDEFDYAFWPYGDEPGGDLFWAYGYDDLFAGVLLPYAYAGFSNAYVAAPPAPSAPASAPAAAPSPAAGSPPAQACVSAEAMAGGAPTDAIAKAINPTADQNAKLDALKNAETDAQKALGASCATQTPATAIGRLDAVQARLQAMSQAADAVRGPLGDFYVSLNDEQKATFNTLGQSQGALGQPSFAKLCGPNNAVPVIAVDPIVKAIQPDAKQRTALTALQDAATKADDAILASCPSQSPLTPPGRLDAVRARLQAMLSGIDTVRPALQDFYGSLSDEQKARFDALTLPVPANAASATTQ